MMYTVYPQTDAPEHQSLAELARTQQAAQSLAAQLRAGTRFASAAPAPALDAFCMESLQRVPMDALTYFVLNQLTSGERLSVLACDARMTTLPDELARAGLPCVLLTDCILVSGRYVGRISALLRRLRSAVERERTDAQASMFDIR